MQCIFYFISIANTVLFIEHYTENISVRALLLCYMIRQITFLNYWCCLFTDFAHCGNMSEAEEIYKACMSIVTAKEEAIQARNTWLLVGGILVFIIATGALILFWYLRNKRKKQRKGMGTNNNTDKKCNSRIEEEEATTADTLLEGNKS
jgi:hypothetical protein